MAKAVGIDLGTTNPKGTIYSATRFVCRRFELEAQRHGVHWTAGRPRI